MTFSHCKLLNSDWLEDILPLQQLEAKPQSVYVDTVHEDEPKAGFEQGCSGKSGLIGNLAVDSHPGSLVGTNGSLAGTSGALGEFGLPFVLEVF